MSFADRDGLMWFDDEMVPRRRATVHILTHTLHCGIGVFEGVRAYQTDKGPAVFRLQAHTDRLFEIDGRAVGEGKRDPITERLQAAFFDLRGRPTSTESD